MSSRRVLPPAVAAVVAAAVLAPAGTAGGAARVVQLAIVHVVHGCHALAVNGRTSTTARLVVVPGTRLEIRDSCPMDFDFAQLRGPRLALGDPRTYAGTVRRIVFARRGVYRLRATNVQSSEQQGLQTLGPDSVLVLTVVVR